MVLSAVGGETTTGAFAMRFLAYDLSIELIRGL